MKWKTKKCTKRLRNESDNNENTDRENKNVEGN